MISVYANELYVCYQVYIAAILVSRVRKARTALLHSAHELYILFRISFDSQNAMWHLHFANLELGIVASSTPAFSGAGYGTSKAGSRFSGNDELMGKLRWLKECCIRFKYI